MNILGLSRLLKFPLHLPPSRKELIGSRNKHFQSSFKELFSLYNGNKYCKCQHCVIRNCYIEPSGCLHKWLWIPLLILDEHEILDFFNAKDISYRVASPWKSGSYKPKIKEIEIFILLTISLKIIFYYQDFV